MSVDPRRVFKRCRAASIVVIAAMLASAARGQFPDLTVTEIDIDPVNPAVNQSITVTITARNIGNETPFSDTFCYLYHNSAAEPNQCGFNQLERLAIGFPPQQDRIFTFTVQYPAAGTYRLWAWLDACESSIPEWSDNNNNLSRDIVVGVGDLTIDSIAAGSPDPVPGELVATRVVVRNSGPAIESQIWRVGIVFQPAEPTGCVFTQLSPLFQDFAANATFEVTFDPRVYEAAGAYPVWAWVDCLDDVIEANDNNNKLGGSIIIGRPDLLVDSVTPSVATATINQPFDVSVVVRNAGSRELPASEVALVADQLVDPGQICPAMRQPIAALAAGASTTVTFPVTLTEARAYRIWGIGDACDLHDEAREDNNTRSIDVNVADDTFYAPDLVVESIAVFEIPTVEWGAVTTFDVTVRNAGTVVSSACRVGDFAIMDFPGLQLTHVVVIGSPGPGNGGRGAVLADWGNCTWRSREIPALVPGASATVQFWRYFSQSGRYSFGATADVCGELPYNSVFETSESNNALTVEFDVVACAADADNDGICDPDDLCPTVFDRLNNDSNNDGEGDACDSDDDGDGVDDSADCEPRNRFIYPGAAEGCTDGIDNNCNGVIDEGAQTLYRDADGDGFGNAAETVRDCSRDGFVTNAADCDDARDDVFPGANGRCDDGIDNDCDGIVDNERPLWGRDADADGFSDPNDVIRDDDGICDGQPNGYILATAIADPDDGDFMNPRPVTASPDEVNFATPQGPQVNVATIELMRDGLESYEYAMEINYGSEGSGWLAIDPPSGSAIGGRATIRLVPTNVANLSRVSYSGFVNISINGRVELSVPIRMTVRNPLLRVVHSGQGVGSVGADYFEGQGGNAVSLGEYDTDAGTFSFEAEVPLGESVYIYANYDSCSIFGGFSLEDGLALPIDATSNTSEAILIDRDTTVTARFTPNYLLCSACSLGLITLSLVGMHRTRKRR